MAMPGNMIAQGVDVLVVIAKDGVAAAQIVESAHKGRHQSSGL